MIAFVDPDLCIGCTQCAGLCPAVFHMEGVLAVAEPGPIPPEEVPQAVDAANACPVSASAWRNKTAANLTRRRKSTILQTEKVLSAWSAPSG